jgi:hypothetical protein
MICDVQELDASIAADADAIERLRIPDEVEML